jgi:hypothetical protein
MRSGAASASMKWFTVEPVPTPTSRRHHLVQRGLADQGLEFVLRHAPRLSAARRLRQSRPMALVPYALTRPFLFGLDPEHAHDLTLEALARLQNTPAQCLWRSRASTTR